ncbi:MAG: response regulator [Myxococcales bacterium FL481]|nr:MAG: response regulator [Myxococcales bacterium FL481]
MLALMPVVGTIGLIGAVRQGVGHPAAVVGLHSELVFVALLVYVRRTGRHEIPGFVVGANMLFALFMTGHLGNPQVEGKVAWLAVAPMVTMLLSGPRTGVFFLGATVVVVVTEHRLHADVGRLSPENLTALLAAVLFAGILARLYERFIQEDAREIQTYHDELSAALDRAREANAAKSAFLANMSHEIRTPLHGVIGLLDLVNPDARPGEEAEYIRHARAAAKSLLTIVSDVLDLSKIDAGGTQIENIPYSPRELVEEIVGTHRVTLRPGVKLETDIAADVPDKLLGDPTRVRQILANFVSNAAKFTERGHIQLRVAATAFRHHPGVRFEVEDSGTGIPPHRLRAIFDPFTQVDASTTRHYGGTGLGLTLCRRLSRLMGGEVGVDSEPGRGSTFWLALALRRPAVTAGGETIPESRSAPAPRRAAALRLLVAEDNPVNRLVISRQLSRLGHLPTLVENGAEAVEAAADGEYDAIFLDLQMPVMDGFEACEAIRRIEGPRGRKRIVALTASVLESDRLRSQEVGMNGFLSKPMRLDELEVALAKIDSSSRSSAA